MVEFIVLGGAEEIGANSWYLQLDGTGIIIDAGLHPRVRDKNAFPNVDVIGDRPSDLLLVTHAHTDHLGALPYVMRKLPHLRSMMTYPTRDLSHIMLNNSSRLLRSDVAMHYSDDDLDFYQKGQIEMLRESFEAVEYEQPIVTRGYSGRSDVKVSFHWSGHLLGAAGLSIENNGFRIIHTSDVQFDDQHVIGRASLPRQHADVVITEATNCATDALNSFDTEVKRLADFINRITSENGSVLIPSFALGKTQEMLTIIYKLMRKGSIPHLPIHAGGMGIPINHVYDHYCYDESMLRQGFEISDIDFIKLSRSRTKLLKDSYMSTPSIVIASSGMLTKETMSHRLAHEWMKRPNFGIAFIGYQDPSSPGYELLNSPKNEPFELSGQKVSRSCEIERLRFSAHASRDHLVDYIKDVAPKTVLITHGDADACDGLALELSEQLPGTRILIPRSGVSYDLT